MSYEKGKTGFLFAIKQLQDEATRYSKSEKCNHDVLNAKVDTINKLISFYNESEKLISDMEMELFGISVRIKKSGDQNRKFLKLLNGLIRTQNIIILNKMNTNA